MRMPRIVLLASSIVLGLAVPAAGTPVATTKQEHELYGRVFLEPMQSVDYIQWRDEFIPAMELLEELYPRYVEFTSVDKELGDPRAVSHGSDGSPAWHPDDSGDGLPFHLTIVTDERVPDREKEYVFLTNAHAAEPCGREGDIRFLEDLLIWRTTEPDRKLDAATGLTGKRKRISVKNLLQRTKIYFVDTVPDPWSRGDRNNGGNLRYSNGNAGFNTNRLAFHDGWVFPDEESLFLNGYTTLTQPEAAIVKYFDRVRRKELNGRPFAAAADMHGPLPVGAVLLHDQNNSAEKLLRIHDFAERIEQKMEEALGSYITPQGVQIYETIMGAAGDARDELMRAYNRYIGPQEEKALYLTLEWAEYATIWDHLDYTVTGTWGGWAASDAGLGADSISYEVNCASFVPYDGRIQQVFVDNMRAIIETTVVHAALMDQNKIKRRSLKGRVGFYEHGVRVTDADGNPVRPPAGRRNPVYGHVRQHSYNVSNTDYFRDLPDIVSSPIHEVHANGLQEALQRLRSFVVADSIVPDTGALEDFVRRGGTLVLTDSALQMVPDLVKVSRKAVKKDYAYVGYTDLDRESKFTEGLYKRARQMYDPVGLGYPLLMERDQYWPCDFRGECEESPTKNSSPIWSVNRNAWENVGGTTIGTVDPPEDRKGGAEGTDQNKIAIGRVKLGKGEIFIFGGLLPMPSEDYDHWFGINPYTITIAGQELLLRALRAE